MKHFLTNNIGLKILSIVVAAFLWILIINITDPIVTETFEDIPVQVTNEETITSKGYQYNIESGDQIDVKVKGKRSVVSNMKDSGFVAIADFSMLSISPMYMVPIEVTYPDLDPNETIEITPKTDVVSIKLEDSDTLPFNVRIVQTGEVKEGYCVISTTLSTNVIQVTGSQTQVSKIKELVIEVDVDQASEEFETVVNPVAYDLDGNVIDPMKISYNQEEIGVSVLIYPIKEIDLEVVTKGSPAYGYKVQDVEFAPNTVFIAGTAEDLEKINRVTIPCDVEEVTETINSQIDISEALQSVFGDRYILVDETQTVGVIVNIEQLEIRDFYLQESDIELRNLPSNLTCSFSNTMAITLRVLGSKEALENLTIEDLAPYISFTGSTAGTYTAVIRTQYIGDITVEQGTTTVVLEENTDNE